MYHPFKQPENTIRFIVNPVAGKGRAVKLLQSIDSTIDKHKFDVEICLSTHPGHAVELSKEAVNKGVNFIVAVGGDGTINEVASPMRYTKSVLGIIPLGSGNGLARHLGIPLQTKKALQLINDSYVTQIDTAKINGVSFISIAGIGFDALVADRFSKSKQRGFSTYFKSVLREYWKYEEQDYIIDFDSGYHFNGRAFFISFANSGQFGYNTVIAPNAKLNDNKLDICIVRKPRIFDLPIVSLLLLKRKIHESSLIKTVTDKGLTIKSLSHGKQLVNLDGESVLLNGELKIEVEPLSIQIIKPNR